MLKNILQQSEIVKWGEENSLYHLRSDHFDLDYLFTFAVFGRHPRDVESGPMTNEEAVAWITEIREDYRISINGVISINTSSISDEDTIIAWRAVETFALLTGHDVIETHFVRNERNDFNNGEFATITFRELEEGLKRSELPGYDPDGPESTYNDGIAGLAQPGVTSAPTGEPRYFNGGVEVLPSLDTRFKQYVYIHEIAHIFRVKGSQNSGLDTAIDNTRFLSTSYNAPGEHQQSLNFTPVTPMIVDILVIKQFDWLAEDILPGDTTFGVNSNTGMSYDHFFSEMVKTENNFAMTIMDTGGYDTLNFSDHDTTVHGQTLRINMNPYWTSDVYNTPGNFIIGPDTWIEAAIGGASDDHITGNILDNHIDAGAGDDTILSGPGDDVLIGGPGADLLDGHTGNDTVSYAGSSSRVDVRLSGTVINFGDAAGDTLISIENLIGSDHNDTLAGNGHANVLDGGPGNDLVWGSGGPDRIIGGPGADRLVGGHGDDIAEFSDSPAGVQIDLSSSTLSGGEAQGDRFSRFDTIEMAAADGTITTIELPDIEGLLGSAFDDTLIGDLRDNVLSGAAGDDVLAGLAGADTLMGGPGQDTLSYSASNTGVIVRLHAHTAFNGHAEGDTFAGTVSVPYTDAEGVVQTDSLPDIEHLTGSAHRDILAGDRRDNVLDGNAGHDTLYGGPGGGDDMMHGGPGNDTIYGGAGDDTLIGGPGDDTLVPGAGRDALVFDRGDGTDRVLRFDPSEDKIDLTGLDLPETWEPFLRQDGNNTVLDLTRFDGGEVVFENVSLNENMDVFVI